MAVAGFISTTSLHFILNYKYVSVLITDTKTGANINRSYCIQKWYAKQLAYNYIFREYFISKYAYLLRSIFGAGR